MSLVPEGVSADVDLCGSFEPSTTIADLELTKYARGTESREYPTPGDDVMQRKHRDVAVFPSDFHGEVG